MVDTTHYAYRVIWSEEDQEFVGLCAEFPSLSHLDENQIKALQGITELVSATVDAMKEDNEPIPEPISKKKYSGKFQIRLAPHRHRMLAMEAAEQGVSLNRLASDKLA